MEASKLHGAYVDPRNAKRKFSNVLEDFKQTRKGAAGTLARDDSAYSVHVLPHFGNMPLGSIDRSQVQAWVQLLEAKRLAPATVKREYQALQKVLSWAVDEEELIVRNPCRRIRFATRDEELQDRRFYTPEEIEQLYEAMVPRYRALILTGCYAGLRIGEMAGLHADNVSLLERRIYVRQGLTETGGRAQIGPLKTRHSRGTVEIPVFLADELASHLDRFPTASGLVFTSPEGGLLRPSLWRQRYWHPAVEKSIGEPARPHDMRHTFVSILIDQGTSVEKVCEQARHSDPSFTWRVYKHSFDKRNAAMEQAMAALETVRFLARSSSPE